MTNKTIGIGAILFLCLAPFSVFAHETRMYEIDGVLYEMVVGSLNEPVIVDDKTGVSVEIIRDGVPLQGAQESLQVEMIAGDVSRVVNLSPVHGADGQYKSNFIATVPTTLTYRVFGTLEDIPVDLSFTCNPAGHPAAEEVTTKTTITDGVEQTLKRGSFGCPQAKEAFGFPEAAPSALALQEKTVAVPKDQSSKNDSLVMVALLLALVSGGIAVAAYKKK